MVFRRPHTAKEKERISEALMGHIGWNRGKKMGRLTKAHRQAISKANKGRIFSLDHKRKLSEAHKGEKNYNFGKHLSPLLKRKIGEAQKGEKNHNYKGGRKLARIRFKARRRTLGSVPLNEPFRGSEGHHIDRQHIVFIPKELHRSVWHSLNDLETMEKINTKVWNFLGVARQ